MNNSRIIMKAARFAAVKHTGQTRKGAKRPPYINHPLEVADLILNVGLVDDTDVIVAALLHDTVEDTATTPEELEQLFGAAVRGYVLEVTDNKSLPKSQRKLLQIAHAPHLSRQAKIIKLADKISNIREILEDPPEGWDIARRREYVEWGRNVVDGLRGANRPLETRFDELVVWAGTELG